jgi:hypothetical protein
MIGLLALLIVGCAIVGFGLRVLFGMLKPQEEGWEFPEIELMELVELRALSFQNFSRFFSNSDYQLLHAERKLVQTAQRLRMDRKRLALEWLAAMRSDVLSLWRLRRLLIAYGVKEGTVGEFATTAKVIFILAFISMLRIGVFLFGPFAFQRIVSNGHLLVDTYSRSCRSALGRLPRNRWPEFKAEWRAQQVSA